MSWHKSLTAEETIQVAEWLADRVCIYTGDTAGGRVLPRCEAVNHEPQAMLHAAVLAVKRANRRRDAITEACSRCSHCDDTKGNGSR